MEMFTNLMSSLIDLFYNATDAIGFPSYALAIIMLGIVVRILLLPLSIKQMKSTLGMSEIQPLMKELQTKYAGNREKLAEEMQKLYSEYDVNPVSGCLPILVQMPILYFLFRALRTYDFSIHAANAGFFWINSLNYSDALHILPVVLGIVMFFQQKLALAPSVASGNSTMQMQMKMMVYVMPIMMAVFALQFPSGLCIYWITTSTFMIFQTLYMNHIRKKELAARAEARAQREAERAAQMVEQAKAGHNPSKKKTKQQLKNEHKAKKREASNAVYQAPSKDGEGATYKAPKSK